MLTTRLMAYSKRMKVKKNNSITKITTIIILWCVISTTKKMKQITTELKSNQFGIFKKINDIDKINDKENIERDETEANSLQYERNGTE